ncbi:MAG: ankyrin repeat domain-containing protein [Cyanosarcina radialis HA8281-LM2]|jgi:ankyrin repeat protein|nr:ankyrin repeat domain-containing protein [Cyanosarcina radialis HA8281-LM2]
MKFDDVVKSPLQISDIDEYLNQGGDINYRDSRLIHNYHPLGWTLLHYAADEGNIEVIKYLAHRGAALNIVDEKGQTPLDLAVEYDFIIATQDGQMPTEMTMTIAKVVLELLGANDSITVTKTLADWMNAHGFDGN